MAQEEKQKLLDAAEDALKEPATDIQLVKRLAARLSWASAVAAPSS